MKELLERIERATADGADPEAKRQGGDACRAILAALDATPGQPMATVPTAPGPSPLAGLDPGQVLDVVIAKLRAMVPADKADAAATPRSGLTFPFIGIPK